MLYLGLNPLRASNLSVWGSTVGLNHKKFMKEGITMKMTKKEKLELATLIAEAVVKAMKTETTTTTKGRGTANEGKNPQTTNEAPKTKYSTKLTDYEPKKIDGFYKWGKKTDTIKSRNYLAMQKAYCYAVVTKGQAVTSDECYKLGIEVDYSENGAYGKAKAKFRAKYIYIKNADRKEND
jgi:hypothetical protein